MPHGLEISAAWSGWEQHGLGSEDCEGPGLRACLVRSSQVPEAGRVRPCLSHLEPTLPALCIGCLPNSPHLIGIDLAV